MTYFHLECGEEGRALECPDGLQLGESRGYLLRLLHSLGRRRLVEQEVTSRAGCQPSAGSTAASIPSCALPQVPSPVLRPAGRQVLTAPRHRGEAEVRAAPGMGVWPGLLLCPSGPAQLSEDTPPAAHTCRASPQAQGAPGELAESSAN